VFIINVVLNTNTCITNDIFLTETSRYQQNNK